MNLDSVMLKIRQGLKIQVTTTVFELWTFYMQWRYLVHWALKPNNGLGGFGATEFATLRQE